MYSSLQLISAFGSIGQMDLNQIDLEEIHFHGHQWSFPILVHLVEIGLFVLEKLNSKTWKYKCPLFRFYLPFKKGFVLPIYKLEFRLPTVVLEKLQ